MFKTKKEKLEEETLNDEIGSAGAADENSEDIIDNINAAEQNEKSANSKESKPEIKIQKLEKQVTELKDQLLRKAAEFENYKRRTETETANIYRYAGETIITELLTVLDDFDRMMKTWDDKHDVDTLGKGVELVYGKFRKVLAEQGLKEIESLGKPFDVNLHDALMQIESDKLEADTVANEIEKGYFLKDKVIRHAKVAVSKKPE